jgi:hypothetical protein
MPMLYNCKHDGDQYRITKFTDDLNPQSSYLCTERECECPAGHRPMCRHREMLPMFIARKSIDTGWMYDYDRGGWVQGWDDAPKRLTEEELTGEPEAKLPTIKRSAGRRF